MTLLLQVRKLAPQIQHAARIVLDNPDNQEAKEHYQLLKDDYQRQVEKLTGLVDSGVDSVDFIAVSGTCTPPVCVCVCACMRACMRACVSSEVATTVLFRVLPMGMWANKSDVKTS